MSFAQIVPQSFVSLRVFELFTAWFITNKAVVNISIQLFYKHKLSFLWGRYLGVGLQLRRVSICSVSQRSAKLASQTVVLLCIRPSSMYELFHILISTEYHCQLLIFICFFVFFADTFVEFFVSFNWSIEFLNSRNFESFFYRQFNLGYTQSSITYNLRILPVHSLSFIALTMSIFKKIVILMK